MVKLAEEGVERDVWQGRDRDSLAPFLEVCRYSDIVNCY